jgi:hypothetical protein
VSLISFLPFFLYSDFDLELERGWNGLPASPLEVKELWRADALSKPPASHQRTSIGIHSSLHGLRHWTSHLPCKFDDLFWAGKTLHFFKGVLIE